jgi:aquaporin Z
VLFAIANGKPGFNAVESGFASNGYGDRSPGGYGLVAALIVEITNLVAIPVTNASVNPARSLGVVWFAG